MEMYERNGNILYILNVLKKHSDEEHMMTAVEIQEKVKELYNVEIDPRTIRRNINLLKEKFQYDISTRQENGKGYFIIKNPETDFEPGEIRAIIDNFSYANYIVPAISKSIIDKCKNMQNVYENEKLKDYQIFSRDTKTQNMEVIKNIEDITQGIQNKNKIKFEYWKYAMTNKLEQVIVSTPKVSPYALVYNNQEFYLVGIKEGIQEFYNYRVDRIKNIEILSENIEIKKDKEQIQEFLESTVEMFGGAKEEVEADVNILLLDAVLEKFGRNITIIKKDEKEFKMLVDINLKGFKMWAMRNIDMVEVIKPQSLRDEMKEIIEKAYKRYK